MTSIHPFPTGCAEKFEARRFIAAGGFGRLYMATQRGLDRPVAIKLLQGRILQDASLVERFLEEARITASISHPHVVVVIDQGYEDGVPWIAYEYLPGPSLRQLIHGAPMPWAAALRIGSQIASALEAAHARGILHRDIKPSNVLEASPGHFKLTDFGIAKWIDGAVQTHSGPFLGSPHYIAPEQVLGQPASPASDVYALGVLLFEMLTGRVPFTGKDPQVIFERHLSESAPPPGAFASGIPPRVDAAVLRALAKAPANRYPGAGALREALEAEVAATGLGTASFAYLYARRVPTPSGGIPCDPEAPTSPMAPAPSAGQMLTEPDREPPRAAAVPAAHRAAAAVPAAHQAAAVIPAAPQAAAVVRGWLAWVGAVGGWLKRAGAILPSAGGLGAAAALVAGLSVVVVGLWLVARPPASPPRSTVRSPPPRIAGLGTDPRLDAFARAVKDAIADMESWTDFRDRIFALIGRNPLQVDLADMRHAVEQATEPARSSLAVFADIDDRLARAFPDLRRAPGQALGLWAHTRAWRFIAWSRVEGLVHMRTQLDEARHRGNDSPEHVLWVSSQLRCGPGGAPLLDAFFTSGREMLRSAAAEPERAGPELVEHLWDLWVVARTLVFTQWTEGSDPRLGPIRKFRQGLEDLSGRDGRTLGRLAAAFWDWGAGGMPRRETRAHLVSAVTDLRELSRRLPGARGSLEAMAGRVWQEAASERGPDERDTTPPR